MSASVVQKKNTPRINSNAVELQGGNLLITCFIFSLSLRGRLIFKDIMKIDNKANKMKKKNLKQLILVWMNETETKNKKMISLNG